MHQLHRHVPHRRCCETAGNFFCIVQIRLAILFPWALLTLLFNQWKKVQNTATHLVLRAPQHQHCTLLLQQLHWPNQIQNCLHVLNAITGSASSYLSELHWPNQIQNCLHVLNAITGSVSSYLSELHWPNQIQNCLHVLNAVTGSV